MSYDRYGRKIDYVRISLTDQCNLRCVYCMPADMKFRPTSALMSDEEILRLVRLLAEGGATKVRLTGGEPTLRENVVELVRHIARTPGVREVAMTTNGILLKHLAKPLVAAGLKRINVSIDTLNASKFKELTRWGNIDEVHEGIAAAEAAGLPIKLNAVVVRGQNDTADVIELARLTLTRAWQVRFLEVMPIGSIAQFQRDHVVPEEELRATIAAGLGPLNVLNQGLLDGEARVFQLAGAVGTIGFISPVTKPFCAGCNRVRLTADGKMRLCLLREREVDLLKPMRDGCTDEELFSLIEHGIWNKPWGHGLAGDAYPRNRVMSEIGG